MSLCYHTRIFFLCWYVAQRRDGGPIFLLFFSRRRPHFPAYPNKEKRHEKWRRRLIYRGKKLLRHASRNCRDLKKWKRRFRNLISRPLWRKYKTFSRQHASSRMENQLTPNFHGAKKERISALKRPFFQGIEQKKSLLFSGWAKIKGRGGVVSNH